MPSTNFWWVHNKLLEYASHVLNPQQGSLRQTRCPTKYIETDRGNDTPFENWLKTLNFPTLYLRKDSLVLLQLLKFVKSDFAANLEDYMSFNKRVIRQGAIVTSVESSTVEPKLMIKKPFLV